MREYVTTHNRLREIALKELGEMKRGTTYVLFMDQASRVAKEKGVAKPALMLAITYRGDRNEAELVIYGENGVSNAAMPRPTTEVVYPISEHEWDGFLDGVEANLTQNPTVWAVDDEKFTAPI